jgi:hypothetical protein
VTRSIDEAADHALALWRDATTALAPRVTGPGPAGCASA